MNMQENQQVIPVSSNKSPGGHNSIKIFFILIFLALAAGGGIFAYTIIKEDNSEDSASSSSTNTDEKSEHVDDNETDIEEENVKDDDDDVNTEDLDSYDDAIPETDVTQIMIPEVDLALDALTLLTEANWDGNKDESLPISISDFDENKLNEYITYDKEGDKKLTIPSEDEKYYLTSESKNELQTVALQARQEYLDYLREKGVAEKYINEIEDNTLPEDRIIYYAENDPNSDYSRTEATTIDDVKDYRKLTMHIYPVDIYSRVRIINNSKIFGEPNVTAEYMKKARDAGIRFLIFHEMTHVLQQAYVNQNLPEKYNKEGVKSLWMYADKCLCEVDTSHNREWGGGYAKDSDNRTLNDERQAEGLGYEVFVNVYNLSADQATAFWDHEFERLADERKNLDELLDMFEQYFPEYIPEDFSIQLKTVVADFNGDSFTLRSIAGRVLGLPAYVGYLNPMKITETSVVWDALKD